jgi:hypothetical protein
MGYFDKPPKQDKLIIFIKALEKVETAAPRLFAKLPVSCHKYYRKQKVKVLISRDDAAGFKDGSAAGFCIIPDLNALKVDPCPVIESWVNSYLDALTKATIKAEDPHTYTILRTAFMTFQSSEMTFSCHQQLVHVFSVLSKHNLEPQPLMIQSLTDSARAVDSDGEMLDDDANGADLDRTLNRALNFIRTRQTDVFVRVLDAHEGKDIVIERATDENTLLRQARQSVDDLVGCHAVFESEHAQKFLESLCSEKSASFDVDWLLKLIKRTADMHAVRSGADSSEACQTSVLQLCNVASEYMRGVFAATITGWSGVL